MTGLPGPLVVTGAGRMILGPGEPRVADPTPFLRIRKNRKFMGLQDDLAVIACGRALEQAGLGGAALGERAGLYAVVGFIPFDLAEIDALVGESLGPDGALSMQAFATRGINAVSPLLTFRCLPNMPTYHVSASFDVQGPYVGAYPGPGQLYGALEEAAAALGDGRIDLALVGAVADQRNFLVRHHVARLDPPTADGSLADAAGFLVLETAQAARARGAIVRAELVELESRYVAPEPFAPGGARERFQLDGERLSDDGLDLACASFPARLAALLQEGRSGTLAHRLEARDGVVATSQWRLS